MTEPGRWLLLGLLFLLLSSGCVDSTPLGRETLRGQVVQVVDGDTLDVRLENGSVERVRLLGIDAPETHAPAQPEEYPLEDPDRLGSIGEEATVLAENWVEGEPVRLVVENRHRRGDYGRLLAYVELQNGTTLNLALVERGLARVYVEGESSREGEFLEAAGRAREREVGIWR